jgi:ribonuclease PH
MPKRPHDQVRPISITPHFLDHPEGSALIECGDTRVICTATVDEKVPKWMHGSGKGWVTAEYDMLPRATNSRKGRDSHRGKINGRTQEIGRLIGRSLRSIVDMQKLGERMITIDCDVIQADGGTRTSSITGGYVALAIAIGELMKRGAIKENPLKEHVAAISVGLIGGEPVLDLDYNLDSRADVDLNVVMTGSGGLAEVQGTAEGRTFSRDQLNTMLDLTFGSLDDLVTIQKMAIEAPREEVSTKVSLAHD